MPELSSKDYLEYLRKSYGERPDAYYRQVLTVPLGARDAVLDYGCGLGRMLETVAELSPESPPRGRRPQPGMRRLREGAAFRLAPRGP